MTIAPLVKIIHAQSTAYTRIIRDVRNEEKLREFLDHTPLSANVRNDEELRHWPSLKHATAHTSATSINDDHFVFEQRPRFDKSANRVFPPPRFSRDTPTPPADDVHETFDFFNLATFRFGPRVATVRCTPGTLATGCTSTMILNYDHTNFLQALLATTLFYC